MLTLEIFLNIDIYVLIDMYILPINFHENPLINRSSFFRLNPLTFKRNLYDTGEFNDRRYAD